MENYKETISLKNIIVEYISHWKLFLFTFIFFFIAAVLYIFLYPKTYEIMARIQLQEDRGFGGGGGGLGEAAGLLKSFGFGGGGSSSLSMDDEINMLKSNRLMSEVARDLGINVVYTNPHSFYKLYDKTPYRLSADTLFGHLSGEIEFAVRPKNGIINVKTESKRNGKHNFTLTSLPATIELPEGIFSLDYANNIVDHSLVPLDITYKPAGWTAEEMEKDFTIEVFSKSSNVIEMSCDDYEPNRGLNTLNKLIAYYNREAESEKHNINSQTLIYLDQRIDSLTRDLQLIELAIADFKNTNSLMDVEHDVQYYTSQLSEIQSKITEMETQSHIIRLMSDFIQTPANKYNQMPVLMSQDGEKNSPIQAYNQVLIERARIIQNSNESNPLVANLTLQADKLRESVHLSIENMAKAMQQSINEMKRKEKLLYDTMKRFPNNERDLIELKRQQEIAQGIYLILLQKREETALSNGLQNERARIIDSAYVKKKPIAPRKIYAALALMIFTIVIPVTWIFIRKQTSVLLDEYRSQRNA
jgi:uncharacterized protein involved in exopolysaccharide biosynthesis